MKGESMIASSCKFESLSSREAFNASVRHVKATVGFAERVASGDNLADAINELVDEKAVSGEEILPFVSMLLTDKLGYHAVAKNVGATVSDLSGIQKAVAGWNAFDIVVVYHHPDIGVMAVNPKNAADIGRIDRINKSELVVAYVGCLGKPFDQAKAAKAGEAIIALFEGVAVKDDAAFLKGPCAYKPPKAAAPAKSPKEPKASAKKRGKVAEPPKPAKSKAAPSAKVEAAAAVQAAVKAQPSAKAAAPAAPQPPAGPKPGSRMTPMYGVLVTNELFHNGNVEAWKRIIDSFKVKHPDLDVLVYYDGERIVNLNALFKWGKVKHGSVIQFAVAGENICDVAKLQRYLAQGASPMFEAFLRGPVNGVLALF